LLQSVSFNFIVRFSKVSIIGPGLLGGSLALALHRDFPTVRVSVWARRAEAAREVLDRGIASEATTDLKTAVNGADLVILCVPIGAMEEVATQIQPHLREDAVVTDVGSVKAPVVEALMARLGTQFVGSHPMAGSEQVGLDAARPDLFNGAVCIVTPDEKTDPVRLASVSGFWSDLGCRVASLAPAEHDEVAALISHLPHLVAATLVNLVCARNPDAFQFCGSGFRDTTRVASGPPAMWAEILDGNRQAMAKSVESLIHMLREVEEQLHNPAAMRDFLASAKEQRDHIKLRN
jgi:prephenate dehydrogenase